MKPRLTSRESADQIIAALHEAGHEALLAGGCVRDLLLNREPKDYDVVTDAPPERVTELFRKTQQVGAKFGVVLVRIGGRETEVATFRADGPYSDGRHPDSVTFGNARDDALRRDFTINGMFLDTANDQVIDHVGGRDDLAARVLRAIGDPDQRFEEDHLRMLRAVRFAARLEFEIEPETLAAVRRHADRLPGISTARVRGELKMILADVHRAEAWELLVAAGLVDHLIPAVGFDEEESTTIGRRLTALPGEVDFATGLAALLRTRSPRDAGRVCHAFSCSNDEVKRVEWLLSRLGLLRDSGGLELADVKLMRAGAGFDALCALFRADLLAGGAAVGPCDEFVARAVAVPAEEVAPPPFVTGEDLLSRAVPQGPIYARVIDAIYRAQLNNKLPDRAAAVRMLDALLDAQ